MAGYVTQGKVVRVISVHGTYEVLANSGERFLQCIAINETNSDLYGVHSSLSYSPGTIVIVYVPDGVKTGSSLRFILGAANDIPIIDLEESKNPFSLLSILENTLNFFIKRSDTDVKYAPKDTKLENDYSYGRAADILPGEWAKTTYLGGGFFLNDFLASVSISERTKLEAFFLKDMIRLTSMNYQERIGASDRADFMEGVFSSSVIRNGATMTESLGGVEGFPVLAADTPTLNEPYSYSYLVDQPYYNYQKIAGDLSQGILETYTVPSDDVNENRPVGVLSVYKGYDGTYNVKATKEISFEKTSLIPVPWAVQDPDTELLSDDKSEYKVEDYYTDAEISPEQSSFFGAEAVRQINEHNLEKDSFSKFRVRNKVWDIPADKSKVLEDLKNIGAEFEDDPSIELLDDAPYYEEPPKKAQIKTNVDEEGVRSGVSDIYDISSFIKQAPDGSIIISGGWGEEIRMFRGNVYITCPGDIIKQPGRDHVLFAGGNNIQKANKGTTEIESESTTMITNGNMQMVSGASGVGTMLLESKAVSPPEMDVYAGQMENNTPAGGGIVFKGDTVATVSDNIYLQAENTSQGQITIKTAKMTSLMSQAVTFLQGAGGRMAVVGNNTMFAVSGSLVETVSPQALFNTGYMKLHAGKINVPFKDFDDKTINKSLGTSGLADLAVQSSINCLSLNCGSAISADGEIDKVPTFPASHRAAFQGAAPGNSYAGLTIPESLEEVAKDKELKKWGIVLPHMRYNRLELPVSRWQNMLKNGKNWEPVEIPGSFEDTSKKVMSYPGKENMEAKGSLQKLENGGKIDKQSLATDLIINSE
jgi:hypothetical protein